MLTCRTVTSGGNPISDSNIIMETMCLSEGQEVDKKTVASIAEAKQNGMCLRYIIDDIVASLTDDNNYEDEE